MSTVVISSKGQITLPARFRRELGLSVHSRVSIETEGNAIVIRPTADFFELEGFLGRARSPEDEKEGARRVAGARSGGRS